jgi:hypothetical protein
MYGAFVDLWIHQDRLQWSRITWMLTIETAMIAGAFAKPRIGLVAVVLGSFVIGLLWRIFQKDGQDQQVTLK